MKKIIFVIIFFLFSILSRAEGFGVHVGGQIGYQTTHLSASRADIDASIANHLILGGFGRLVINDFVIQPEIMLFKTAQIFSLEGTDSTHLNVSLETKQQSLAFPMMGGYQFYDSPLIKARATAGLVLYYVVDDANSNNYNKSRYRTEQMDLWRSVQRRCRRIDVHSGSHLYLRLDEHPRKGVCGDRRPPLCDGQHTSEHVQRHGGHQIV